MDDYIGKKESSDETDMVDIEEGTVIDVATDDDLVVLDNMKYDEKKNQRSTNMDVEKDNHGSDDSGSGDLIDEVDAMEVEYHAEANVLPSSSITKDSQDVLDSEKLYNLLEVSKSAGDAIAGKHIILLIGGTGAGKTTTTLYLAGADFKAVDIHGSDHFEPQNLPPNLCRFAVSGLATSVTQTINATPLSVRNGETVTICDTPGFGDTKGTEMEISNGLGVIHALQRAASVKPVLVINAEGMANDRFTPLRKLLGIVIDFMGQGIDFSLFEFVFTRCEGRGRRIHRQLTGLLETLQQNPSDLLGDNLAIKDAFESLLKNMIKKTSPEAMGIDPLDHEAAPEILAALWGNSARIENPSETFIDFISKDASNKLSMQVACLMKRMEKALQDHEFVTANKALSDLVRLADVLPINSLTEAVEDAKSKARRFIHHARSDFGASADHIFENDATGEFVKASMVLREKFCLLSEARQIYDRCGMHDSYSGFVSATVSNLFATIQSHLEEVESDVVENAQVLKGSLQRVHHLSRALEGIVKADEVHTECLNVKKKVFAMIHSIFSLIDLSADISSRVLEESGGGILFLLDMEAFLKDSKIDICEDIEDFSEKLQLAADRFKDHSSANLTFLREMSVTLSEYFGVDDETDETSYLEALNSNDVRECRLYLLSLVRSPLFLEIFGDGNQSKERIGRVVKNFDHDVAILVSKIAEYVHNNTENILKRDNTKG